MLHFSCDLCGKDMSPGVAGRYVVKVEAYAAPAATTLTDDDLDTDHIEEMAKLLNDQEERSENAVPLPNNKKMRFDLCTCCFSKFLADPLGRENAAKFDFSEN